LDFNTVIDVRVATLDEFDALFQRTVDSDNLLGYKLHAPLALNCGLGTITNLIRSNSIGQSLKIIYDHGSAATSRPEEATAFAESMGSADIDFAVLYPLSGPPVLEAYTNALQDQGCEAVVGCVMEHIPYIEWDGGWATNGSPAEMLQAAWALGIRHYELPAGVPLVSKDLLDKGFAGCEDDKAEATFWMLDHRPVTGEAFDKLEERLGAECVNFVFEVPTMQRTTRKLPQKPPVRWTKDDNRNAGPHKDKRKKGTRRQRLDKEVEEQIE
jgi:hypothetical protein